MSYQPKTGVPCLCRPGVQRDNCPACEGTGMKIDFAAIRNRTAQPVARLERTPHDENTVYVIDPSGRKLFPGMLKSDALAFCAEQGWRVE